MAGYLVAEITNEDLIFVEEADPNNQTIFHDSDGVTGIDFPEQIHVSASGRVFAAGFSAPSGIFEYDSAGMEVSFIDTVAIASLGGLRGVRAASRIVCGRRIDAARGARSHAPAS